MGDGTCDVCGEYSHTAAWEDVRTGPPSLSLQSWLQVGFQDRSSILQFTKANIWGRPMTADQLKSPTLAIPAALQVLLVLLGMAVLYHQVSRGVSRRMQQRSAGAVLT